MFIAMEFIINAIATTPNCSGVINLAKIIEIMNWDSFIYTPPEAVQIRDVKTFFFKSIPFYSDLILLKIFFTY